MREDPSSRHMNRLVAREVSELVIARVERYQAVLPLDRISLTIFGVVAGGSISHLPWTAGRTGSIPGMSAISGHARPVSAMSIAASATLPYTTVRRRVTEMVAAGWLERGGSGLLLSRTYLADPRLPAIYQADRDALIAFVRRLAAAEHLPSIAALRHDLESVSADVAARLLLAYALRTIEDFIALYGDMVSGTIMATVTAMNVHHITADPVAARRYAEEDRPPPDEERRPVTLRAVARAADLPFETVRRRAQPLVASGLLVQRAEGYIVPTAWLAGEANNRHNRQAAAHVATTLRLFAALADAMSPRAAAA